MLDKSKRGLWFGIIGGSVALAISIGSSLVNFGALTQRVTTSELTVISLENTAKDLLTRSEHNRDMIQQDEIALAKIDERLTAIQASLLELKIILHKSNSQDPKKGGHSASK